LENQKKNVTSELNEVHLDACDDCLMQLGIYELYVAVKRDYFEGA
jgi:hypothetical protein